jgi:putative transposase
MSRRPRSALSDGFFHVTSRATGGLDLFRDDVDRSAFIQLLGSTALALMWACHAYCLMSTHYHLLLETTQGDLSKGMHRLNGIYAQGFNRRHARKGHLFEERFSSYVIETDEHFEAACRYVLENPVRAALCDHAAQWPWSGGLVDVERLVTRVTSLGQFLGRDSPSVGTVPRY